jgi:TonB family protein
MDRLAKKCVIASSVLHGTLVLVLLVGPAFLPAEKPLEAKQIIDFIPYKTLEASVSGGGNPNVEQTIPQPTPPTPAPQPRRAEQPKQEEPVKREEPAKQETKSEPKSEPKTEAKSEDTSWKPSSKIKVNLKQTVRNTGSSTSRSTSNTSRSTERAQALASAANSIDRGASSPVQISEMRGPGGGGIPYAGFNDALVSAYMRAWLIPDDLASSSAKVKVTVTLRRDGTVISSRIQSRSGNSELDASVQRALDKVNFVAPFPDSEKSAQKTFWLEFDPRAKRMLG